MMTNTTNITCERCGFQGKYSFMNLTSPTSGVEEICFECWNKDMSDNLGIPYKVMRFDNYMTLDDDGNHHVFVINRRIFPTGIFVEAQEIINDEIAGYKFATRGDIYCNQDDLYKDLLIKINNGIKKQLLKHSDGSIQIKDMSAVGHFKYNDEDDRFPLVVIDGKEFTWTEFGSMCNSYEGWKFKLQIYDASDGE